MRPLLYEIRIALADSQDFRYSSIIYFRALFEDRLYDCRSGILFRKLPDSWILEEPFGVGLRCARQPQDLGKARANQNNRQIELRDFVHRHDERAKFLLRKV